MISIIILAGGSGERMASTIPKQFLTINGKRIIDITLNRFWALADNIYIEIIIVCTNSKIKQFTQLYKEESRVKVVPGSDTRFKSFMNGYKAIREDSDNIFVHDAVRPIIYTDILYSLHNELRSFDAAIPYIKPFSSTTLTDSSGSIVNINRDFISLTQTPEAFRRTTFDKFINDDPDFITTNKDRTSIFSLFVDKSHHDPTININLIPGSQDNIKITTRHDIDIATHLLNKQPLVHVNDYSFKDKRILIFGGTGGIGSQITHDLLNGGANVTNFGSDIPIEEDDAFTKMNNIGLLDLKYDGIVHAVGTMSYQGQSIIKEFGQTTLDEFKYCIDVMLTSAYKTAKLAIDLLPNGGHLVFIGSSASFRGRDKFALYATPKSALNVFVESIAEEFNDKYKIKVNIVIPAVTKTKMTEYLPGDISQRDLLSPEIVSNRVMRYLKCDVYGHSHSIRVGDHL